MSRADRWMRPEGQRYPRTGPRIPGFFREKICPHCGREFLPSAGAQKWCSACRDPARRYKVWEHPVCGYGPCHNLLVGGRRPGKRGGWRYCSQSCAQLASRPNPAQGPRPPAPPRLPASNPTRMVVDFVVRGESLEAIARRAGFSTPEVVEVLERWGVRDPLRERTGLVPAKLLRALSR